MWIGLDGQFGIQALHNNRSLHWHRQYGSLLSLCVNSPTAATRSKHDFEEIQIGGIDRTDGAFWFETLGFRLKPEVYNAAAIVAEVKCLLDSLAEVAVAHNIDQVWGEDYLPMT